jgi:hypothetical protein
MRLKVGGRAHPAALLGMLRKGPVKSVFLPKTSETGVQRTVKKPDKILRMMIQELT